MKISLLHPSRGRAVKAFETMCEWIANSSKDHAIEYVLSIDMDDSQIEDYKKLFQGGYKVIIGDNQDVVQATNRAAAESTGDILIYLSDDFKCPKNWDLELINRFIGIGDKPALVKVDDCLQKFHIAVLTIPIMNRQLYSKLGYFWHPGYKSMFVDEDLYWTCWNNNWMFLCEELKFPHEHVCNGKAENDETYKRSALNWDQGKAFFANRKQLNFPLI